MKTKIEEQEYEGTGIEIMDQLRGLVFDPLEFPDTESYIRFLQGNAMRTTGLDFPLPPGDPGLRFGVWGGGPGPAAPEKNKVRPFSICLWTFCRLCAKMEVETGERLWKQCGF